MSVHPGRGIRAQVVEAIGRRIVTGKDAPGPIVHVTGITHAFGPCPAPPCAPPCAEPRAR